MNPLGIDVFDSWGWAVNAAADELSHICGTVVCSIGVFFMLKSGKNRDILV